MSPTSPTLVLTVALLSACQGLVGDAGVPIGTREIDPPPPTVPDAGFMPPPGGVVECRDPDRASSIPLRRLSRLELTSTLNESLDANLGSAVESLIDVLPEDELVDSVQNYDGSSSDVVSAGLVRLSIRLAAEIRDDPSRVGAACSDASSDACRTHLLDSVAPSLFRRPLWPAEQEGLQTVLADASSPAQGVAEVMTHLLQSPPLMFHLEQGQEDTPTLPDSFEVAARFSFALTGGPPDSELFAAAASGTLTSREALLEHAPRLTDTDEFRSRIRSFVTFLLSGQTEASIPAGHSAFLDGVEPDGLAGELSQELALFLDHILQSDGNQLSSLYSSTRVFPPSERVADIYGVEFDGSTNGQEALGRPGVLLRATLLSGAEVESSPIVRGNHILKHVLCSTLPFPLQEDVAARVGDVETDTFTQSTRERVHLVTAVAPCSNCHTQINPLGFMLEEFDSLGRFRTEQRVFDDDGNFAVAHPVDTAVTWLFDGQTFEFGGVTDFTTWLSDDNPYVSACAAKRTAEFVRMRALTVSDECLVSQVQSTLRAPDATFADALIEAALGHALSARTISVEE